MVEHRGRRRTADHRRVERDRRDAEPRATGNPVRRVLRRARVVALPDRPESVEIAVVEEEQGVERALAAGHGATGPGVAGHVAAALQGPVLREVRLVLELGDDVGELGQGIAAVVRGARIGPVVEAPARVVAPAEEGIPWLGGEIARIRARPVPVGQDGVRIDRLKILLELEQEVPVPRQELRRPVDSAEEVGVVQSRARLNDAGVPELVQAVGETVESGRVGAHIHKVYSAVHDSRPSVRRFD